MTVPSTSTKYRISADGVDYMEGPSKFKRENNYSQINIHNISGIVTLGDGNTIVNENYADLYQNLERLQRAILDDKKLSDEDKLNISADINSIKNQLETTKPLNSSIESLWENLKEKLLPLTQFALYLTEIARFIHHVN